MLLTDNEIRTIKRFLRRLNTSNIIGIAFLIFGFLALLGGLFAYIKVETHPQIGIIITVVFLAAAFIAGFIFLLNTQSLGVLRFSVAGTEFLSGEFRSESVAGNGRNLELRCYIAERRLEVLPFHFRWILRYQKKQPGFPVAVKIATVVRLYKGNPSIVVGPQSYDLVVSVGGTE